MCKKARRHGELGMDQLCKKKKKKSSGDLMPSVVKKKYNCENFITINKRWGVCLSDGNAMIQYSAEWGPCINCYQCEMCFSTRYQLTITDSDRKTEVGRGQPFFPLFFFFRILPSDYRTADCLHSCFFSCCRHPFPFPPSFLLIPSQVVQWRPSSHYWGLIGCVRLCALPHAGAGGDTQRRDGEDSQTSALTPAEAELWLVSVGGKVRVTVF